ncbi:hypothetical protein HanIR_Chr03g0134001 [Helianthus annuus]|nr:hypothetical protein HanIR_Chr03g0134001 [Helianthus annuus]
MLLVCKTIPKRVKIKNGLRISKYPFRSIAQLIYGSKSKLLIDVNGSENVLTKLI